MKNFLMVFGVFLLLGLLGFSSAANAQTISFTGSVKSPGNPPVAVSGALIAMVGNASVNAVSAADGTFTVAGLPSGTNFSLKVSASGFVPVYTSIFNSASNIVSPREYMLQTVQQITGWGITQGKSAIAGRVVDNSNPQTGYIGGATVTFTSSLHPTNPPYTIGYQDSSGPIGGTATYPATGKFFVLNVDDGDTVTVTVTKQDWTFTPKVFVTHVDGVSQGAVFGTASANPNQQALTAGWNFVSFPKQPPDTAIATILSGILSDVKVVWGFDNDQKVWKRYKPAAGDNTLTSLEQGKGYWIFLSADHTLDLTTWTSVSSQVHLYEGWNLVGYSGTNSANIIPSLTSVSGWQVAWVWISGTWKADSALGLTLPIPPVSTFSQGKAYWIKMGTGTSGNWDQ